MTNFQTSQKSWATFITPERAVLVLPIAAGFFLSLIGVFFGVVPLAIRYQKQASMVANMEKKVKDIPAARLQRDESIRQYNITLNQQNRLLNLVAGTAALRTWLTSVNRLANSHKISILKVEPHAREIYIPPLASDTTRPSSKPVNPIPVDPLLVPSIEKRSATITFQGEFKNLLLLMRSIELLDSIVVASDMKLDLVPSTGSTSVSRPHNSYTQPTQTRLQLKFSGYGRIHSANQSDS